VVRGLANDVGQALAGLQSAQTFAASGSRQLNSVEQGCQQQRVTICSPSSEDTPMSPTKVALRQASRLVSTAGTPREATRTPSPPVKLAAAAAPTAAPMAAAAVAVVAGAAPAAAPAASLPPRPLRSALRSRTPSPPPK
jgi:hypothetical protein